MAVAVNCRVAPTTTLGVDEVTETDVSVLGGGTVLAPPPHPVFAITSGREQRQARMEISGRRRMATCMNLPILIPEKCELAKNE